MITGRHLQQSIGDRSIPSGEEGRVLGPLQRQCSQRSGFLEGENVTN